MTTHPATLSPLFKALGDPVRMRLLHLLAAEELTVGELVRILELPQSSVSRHLKALRERALLADRPVGSASYYHAAIEAEHPNGDGALRDALARLLRETPLPPADRRRLDQILALREGARDDFFDQIGLRWDALRESCFGATFHLEAFLRLLPREWTVADLGCGTGYLLPPLAGHFRRVVGVDMSEPMLALARRRLDEQRVRGVELLQGSLERLPLNGGDVDLAVAILMLHHLDDLPGALGEIRRVLRPGGRLLIIELHPYENERFRAAMNDRRSGMAPGEIARVLRRAGLAPGQTWDVRRADPTAQDLAPVPEIYGLVAEAQ